LTHAFDVADQSDLVASDFRWEAMEEAL
jgi:hypothetical protein